MASLHPPDDPPDRGKEWMDIGLPHTDEEEPFDGFSEQETLKEKLRKRRENDTQHDKQNKVQKTIQTQPTTRSQTQKTKSTNEHENLTPNTKVNPSNDNKSENLNQANSETTTQNNKMSENQNQTKSNGKTFWIQNNQHDVLFIEPIEIKEGEILLEPMEVGKFLHDAGLDQFQELKRAGQYRYKLMYKKPKHAEKILNATQILKQKNYKATIPKMLLETTGIVKNVPTSFTEKEIYQNMISDKKITKIERIKKRKDPKDPKSNLVNTRSVKITVEGPELPRTVSLYGVFEKPEIYIYPVRICTKCWRLGHKEKACKSRKTCIRCGEYDTDEHTGCDKTKCRNCGGNHIPTLKNCPERVRMEHINVAMTVNKMTFHDAEQLYPKPNIKTSNKYALLESTVEFPQMEQPSTTNKQFRQVNKTVSNKLDYRQIIQTMTNKEHQNPTKKTKPEIRKNTFPTVETYPEQVHVIENNPHKVTETEKLQTEQKNLTKQLQNIIEKIQGNSSDNKLESDVLLIEIASMIQNLIKLTTSLPKT